MNDEALKAVKASWDSLFEATSRGPVAVLTGAGLSTASGIPAYRDHLGQWQHPRPVLHQDFVRSETVRRRYWARSYVGWRVMGHAKPNMGHEALAELGRQGAVAGVVTQNVDGLHLEAGSTPVIELHGSIRHVRCMSCNSRYERALVQDWLRGANPDFEVQALTRGRAAPDGDAHLEEEAYAHFIVPACPKCGGMLKPDVVFFGDNVPKDRVVAAAELVSQATALVVVGSSLMVYSGYRFAEQAHRLGVPIIAINHGLTRADPLLAAKLDMDCSAALADWVSNLAASRTGS